MCDRDRQELNERLLELAKEAQRHPPQSVERRRALTKLVAELWRPGRLYRPRQNEFPHIYEDIYDEAKQQLSVYICQHIDGYDPARGTVLNWVNFLMTMRFFNEAIGTILGNNLSLNSSDDIDRILQPNTQPSLLNQIRQCIEDDPEDLFNNAHIRDRPDANFQSIALYRLDGRKWEEISNIFGISVSALSDFYQRKLREFAPIIRLSLQN